MERELLNLSVNHASTAKSTSATKLTLVAATLALATCLSACSSTSSDSLSLTQVQEGNAALEKRLLSDYELVKQISSQVHSNDIYDSSMQPKNKRERCLLPFIVGSSERAVYWDGACKGGKAVGLGRAVHTVDNKKVAEQLLEIKPDEKDTLYTYLRFDLGSGESEVGISKLELINEQLAGYSATLGYNDEAWLNKNFELVYRYEDTAKLLSFTKVIDLIKEDYSSIIAYPNFSHEVVNTQDNDLSEFAKTYRILEGRETVGTSYIWLKNGQLILKDNLSGSETLIKKPDAAANDAVLSYVSGLEQQVQAKSTEVEGKIEQGLQKVEEYTNAKCKRPNAFFRGDEVNYVCDYLFNLQHAYGDLLDERSQYNQKLDEHKAEQSKKLKKIEAYLESLQ